MYSTCEQHILLLYLCFVFVKKAPLHFTYNLIWLLKGNRQYALMDICSFSNVSELRNCKNVHIHKSNVLASSKQHIHITDNMLKISGMWMIGGKKNEILLNINKYTCYNRINTKSTNTSFSHLCKMCSSL